MEIQTERLKLRKYINEDAFLFKELLNDEIGRKYTGGIKNKSIEEINEVFLSTNKLFTTDLVTIKKGKGNFKFAIEEISSKQYIGYCGIQYCEILNDIELLYGLKREYWGNGYGYESANTIINFAFANLSLELIFAAVNPENQASERILKKCGFRYDGILDWPKQGKVNRYKMDKEIWLTTAST